MSDTPRTDALIFEFSDPEDAMIPPDFARQLERENAELRAALTALINGVQEWCDAVKKDSSWDGWDEHYKDFAYRGGLDAARAALTQSSPNLKPTSGD